MAKYRLNLIKVKNWVKLILTNINQYKLILTNILHSLNIYICWLILSVKYQLIFLWVSTPLIPSSLVHNCGHLTDPSPPPSPHKHKLWILYRNLRRKSDSTFTVYQIIYYPLLNGLLNHIYHFLLLTMANL